MMGDDDELDDAELDAELDREEFAADQQLRTLGVADEQIARMRGRASPADLVKAPPTLASIEKELAELQALRRTDKRKYYGDAVQAREAELYSQLEKLKAGKPTRKADAPPEKAESDEDIIDADSLPLPESLKEQWRRTPGGIVDALNAIRSRAGTILTSLGEEENDALMRSFDTELDPESQAAIAAGLADDAGKWPVATDAEIADFRAMEGYGPALLQEWGKDAAKSLGRAKREANNMLAAMSDVARTRTERWIAGMSAKRKAAVIRALATRATRRL